MNSNYLIKIFLIVSVVVMSEALMHHDTNLRIKICYFYLEWGWSLSTLPAMHPHPDSEKGCHFQHMASSTFFSAPVATYGIKPFYAI